MDTVKFDKYKFEISERISQKLRGIEPDNDDGYILIEGFINLTYQNEVGGLRIGGPTVPTVAAVSKNLELFTHLQ
jgi:hypothetical protein